jgi:hypothetical protein
MPIKEFDDLDLNGIDKFEDYIFSEDGRNFEGASCSSESMDFSSSRQNLHYSEDIIHGFNNNN